MTTITLSKSNTKIGNIASFSIPSKVRCLGKTLWCEKHCYAYKLEVRFPNVLSSYKRNFEATKDMFFVDNMEIAIKKLPKKIKIIRIHVSGDFYSQDYIYDWTNIIANHPDYQFYTYTKAWRITELLPALELMKSLPNLTMFASTDIDTVANGEKVPQGWREAYSGDIQPKGSVFCPNQAGKIDTCEHCKLCVKPKLTSTIYFKTH